MPDFKPTYGYLAGHKQPSYLSLAVDGVYTFHVTPLATTSGKPEHVKIRGKISTIIDHVDGEGLIVLTSGLVISDEVVEVGA